MSLIEVIAATAVVGLTIVTAGGLIELADRSSKQSSRAAELRQSRWELVRALRQDIGEARSASVEDGGRLLRLQLAGGEITWTSGIEGLRREAGTLLRRPGFGAGFVLERRHGRRFVSYVLEQSGETLEGSALVGGSR